jgi:aspartate racemase
MLFFSQESEDPLRMSKHIGIVGCSAEGASLCYRTICAEAEPLMGEHRHPEVSMHTFALSDYMKYIIADDWNSVGELMAASARKLAEIGADFVICPDNTIHQAFDVAASCSPIPWLHIGEAVAMQAAQRGFRKVGITGTVYLMSGPVYPTVFRQHDIDWATPGEDEQATINRIIFDELVKGEYTPDAKQYFVDVFARLEASGCDAVVMGCTEIPLLMDGVKTTLPAIDSTRTLARAALTTALA